MLRFVLLLNGMRLVLHTACRLQDLSWSKLQISSKAQPTNRSGHVATLVNDTMLVFGGACNSRLQTFWSPFVAGSASVAAVHTLLKP
jgi:hypothetical protein